VTAYEPRSHDDQACYGVPHLAYLTIIYHPQSGWFEDTPLKGVPRKDAP
jgi:hypothetical protein